MKTVHHATLKKIIREHEASERILVAINGSTIFDMEIGRLREMDRVHGSGKGLLRVDLGHMLRDFSRFTAGPLIVTPTPPSLWQKIRKRFSKTSLKKLVKKLTIQE